MTESTDCRSPINTSGKIAVGMVAVWRACMSNADYICNYHQLSYVCILFSLG
jgi:hypothetical protein